MFISVWIQYANSTKSVDFERESTLLGTFYSEPSKCINNFLKYGLLMFVLRLINHSYIPISFTALLNLIKSLTVMKLCWISSHCILNGTIKIYFHILRYLIIFNRYIIFWTDCYGVAQLCNNEKRLKSCSLQ